MSDTSIGIIGAGPGGLALAIMLSRAGFDNFAIFDREDGGGEPDAASSRLAVYQRRTEDRLRAEPVV